MNQSATGIDFAQFRARLEASRADLEALALEGQCTAAARAELAETEAQLARLGEQAASLDAAIQQRSALARSKLIDRLCAEADRAIKDRIASFQPTQQ